MKIGILSGAVKNAGDFLIVDRCRKLIISEFPDAELVTFNRLESLDSRLDEVNSCDCLVMAGGPAYQKAAYPNEIKLCDDLNRIKPPIITVGAGGYCGTASERGINWLSFTDKMTELLDRMSRDCTLTCRDYMTARVLERAGYKAVMTGCPAWYDLDNIDRLTFREGINIPYKKICISDPGKAENHKQALLLAKLVKSRYQDAHIVFVFHRGIKRDKYTPNSVEKKNLWFLQEIEKLGIDTIDISYSENGFDIYDDCDLHIGFRVHAHIYNLSKRNISVLIEEDGRGAGVNQVLGLPQTASYELYAADFFHGSSIISKGCRYILKKLRKHGNPFFENSVKENLDALEDNEYRQILSAYSIMRMYYDVMREHIRSIGKLK